MCGTCKGPNLLVTDKHSSAPSCTLLIAVESKSCLTVLPVVTYKHTHWSMYMLCTCCPLIHMRIRLIRSYRHTVTPPINHQLTFMSPCEYAKAGRPGDLVVLKAGPELELMLPLIHTDAVSHQAQHALLNAGRGCNTHQRFACSTWQHNDACNRTLPCIALSLRHAAAVGNGSESLTA